MPRHHKYNTKYLQERDHRILFSHYNKIIFVRPI